MTEQSKNTGRHNYQKVLEWLIKSGKLTAQAATRLDVTVRHDDWCKTNQGGVCNCYPEVVKSGQVLKYPKSILKGK